MQEPPLVLVKTWYELLIQTECKVAQSHAERNLQGNLQGHPVRRDKSVEDRSRGRPGCNSSTW
jgi:hypothetical protein